MVGPMPFSKIFDLSDYDFSILTQFKNISYSKPYLRENGKILDVLGGKFSNSNGWGLANRLL